MWNKGLYMVVCLIFFSCSKPVTKVLQSKKAASQIPGNTQIVYQDDFTLTMSSAPETEVAITYLGCGGIFLKYDQEAILFDPFFSNKNFFSLPFKKIKPNLNDIDFGLNKVNGLDATKAIFISHAHYDHLFDAPYVLENRLSNQAQFYGSESANKMISPAIKNQDRLHVVSEENWIDISEKLRVMPIKSAHAPHFRFLFPIKFYKGKGKKIKGYDTPTSKTKATQWKEGQTYSFLIDIQDRGNTIFRIFLQSSASDSPIGFPSSVDLQEKAVDLAILGAASFNWTKNKDYPWKLLGHLDPKELIICHWEDFFLPYQKFPKEFVRFSNFKKFLPKLYQHYPRAFYLPEPGVTIKIKY